MYGIISLIFLWESVCYKVSWEKCILEKLIIFNASLHLKFGEMFR